MLDRQTHTPDGSGTQLRVHPKLNYGQVMPHALVIWVLLPRHLLGAAQAEAAQIAPCVGCMHS